MAGSRVTSNPPAEAIEARSPSQVTGIPKISPEVKMVSKPSEIITNSIGMKLKLIPAGEFLMGSPDSDEMAMTDERPQHRVEITTPFYLGVYPVTQGDYKKVTGRDLRYFRGNDQRPIENVTWFDAIAFCNKLSGVEMLKPYYKINGENVTVVGGNGYRLPTEAEWEYACRAGTLTRCNFGKNESQLKKYAWCDQIVHGETHPVGEKKPNRWGLYDMYGNVWEWCWDWYGNYKDSQTNDPSGPTNGDWRVLRGGSFCTLTSHVCSTYRFRCDPNYPDIVFGFRMART